MARPKKESTATENTVVEKFAPVLMKVRVTLLEDMLGTAPNDPEIMSTYIASKSPDAKSKEEEIESVGIEEYEAKQMTVFHRNEDGEPILFNYLIKGFFKNACSALRYVEGTQSKKLTSYKKKIDGLIFVDERKIKINMAGEMRICQRPLRAQTPQGERVGLASSETVPAGSTLEFTIRIMDKSLVPYVEEWLDYGKYNGLGQWHNSGKGSFTWEEIA